MEDVIIIGGGPGGYVAAIIARQLGLKTTLIEKENLGGICLNWGCIPTKALLKSAEVYRMLKHAEDFGLQVKDVSFSIDQIVARSRKVSTQLTSGIKHLMKKNQVTVYEGEAQLVGKNKVKVKLNDKDIELSSKNIVVATGARARILPGFEPDGEVVWTYKEAMVPKKMPKSIIVVGSGAIGIEFASFYNSFGVDVTVIEMMDRILPVEDIEISQLAQKSFEKQNMKILTKASIKSLKKNKTAVLEVEWQGALHKLEADKIIMAVGIVGNTENLGLDKTKVKIENNHIVTNDFCETDEPGIFAIGDVAGAPWLAHKASHEAIICIERIASVKNSHKLKKNLIPGCTYSYPQIASVGLTEAKAKEAGFEVKVGKFPFMANGKATALGESEGLIKTVFDAKTGELLGAHMIGVEVTELIQGYVVGMNLETTEAEIMNTVFAHPTLSEMMHESVLNAFGKTIHF